MDMFGQKVRESSLRWYGEVKHWDDDYMDRKVLEMRPPGKRKQGRPTRRYFDVVKVDMQEVGVFTLYILGTRALKHNGYNTQ